MACIISPLYTNLVKAILKFNQIIFSNYASLLLLRVWLGNYLTVVTCTMWAASEEELEIGNCNWYNTECFILCTNGHGKTSACVSCHEGKHGGLVLGREVSLLQPPSIGTASQQKTTRYPND